MCKICIYAYKGEYQWKNFFFGWHDKEKYDRRTFFRGSTLCGIELNFLWRFLTFVYMISMTIIFNILWKTNNPEDFAVNHLYFTNWGDYTSTIYFGLALYLYVAEVLYQLKTKKIPGIDIEANRGNSNKKDDSCLHPHFWTCLRSITRLFHCCALQMETSLTVIYWYFITCKRREDCRDLSFFNIHRHGLIALLLFLDFWISSFPIRLFHAAWGMVFGCFYIAASYKGHVVDGIPPVYNELDWSEGPYFATAGWMFLFALIGSLVVQHVFFCFHCCCRSRCIKACARPEDESPRPSSPAESIPSSVST